MKNWKKYILSVIWAPILVTQFVLVLFLAKVNNNMQSILVFFGWIIWLISLIFGIFPIIIFKIKGKVPKGKSYMNTTILVDTGLYSIIRHPQYTAGLLLSFALILISQTKLITTLGIIVIVFLYVDILSADQEGIEKFGNEYKKYMKKVPRINFILGILRQLRKNKK